MKLETRVFELSNGKYRNLSELAHAMGISLSYVYRVREGTRSVNRKFIIGAVKAFPRYKLDDLFYVALEESQNKHRLDMSHKRARQSPTPQKRALDSKVMLRIRDVAKFLGVHVNTVRRWSNKGIIRSYRIGSRRDRRFWREDVENFLKEREIE